MKKKIVELKELEKVSKKKHKWPKRAAVITGFFGMLLLVMLSIQLKEIEVDGNEYYTSEEIVSLTTGGREGKSAVLVWLQDKLKPHKEIPFIERYEIRFTGISSVEIIVYEKNLVACFSYLENYFYFDRDGIILETNQRKIDGIPLITGLQVTSAVLYEQPVIKEQGIFEDILNLTQRLSANELSVDKIHYDTQGNAKLYIGNIKVVLGSTASMGGKINELKSILPSISAYSGTLYLNMYSEKDEGISYPFEPD